MNKCYHYLKMLTFSFMQFSLLLFQFKISESSKPTELSKYVDLEETYFCIFGTLIFTINSHRKGKPTKIIRLELQILKESQKLQDSM